LISRNVKNKIVCDQLLKVGIDV